jgi:hypothetical protein
MTELVIAVLATTCCLYLASAAAKLRGRRAYRSSLDALAQTGLVPPGLLPTMAAALAAGEALVAAGTATAGVLTAVNTPSAAVVTFSALVLAIALTSILVLGVATVLRRGISARCACFGATSGRLLSKPHLVRNASLLSLLVAALVCAQRGHGQPAAADVAVAALAGGVIGLMLIRFDDLISLLAPVSAKSAG